MRGNVMNCEQTQQLLDEYLDGELSGNQLDLLEAHLNECENCAHRYNEASSLLVALKQLPVPPVRDGYEEKVLSFLKHEKSAKHHGKKGFIVGFGTAIAASFALWMIFSPVSIFKPHSFEVLKVVKLEVKQQHAVDLVFNLDSDLSDATLTLELPERVEIVGYPGKSQFKWKTSLKKGANRLTLPLFATEKQNGILIASLVKDGKIKTFRININSIPPSSTMFIQDNFSANT